MIKAFCNVVDVVNEWVGKWAGFFIIPMVGIAATDVVLRYVFNRPLLWSWDINVQMLGLLVMLGAGYTFLKRGNAEVDVLVARLSPRKRARVDLITGLIFFVVVGVLIWKAAPTAWEALLAGEALGYNRPPVYPVKIVMVIGLILLLLQGVVGFVRNLITVFHPRRES